MGSTGSNCCSDESRVEKTEPKTMFRVVSAESTLQDLSEGVTSRMHIHNLPGGREIDELADEEALKKKNIKKQQSNSNQKASVIGAEPNRKNMIE